MSELRRYEPNKTYIYDMLSHKHKPDPVDDRDFKMPPRTADHPPLPELVDLRAFAPPVYSQGSLMSCSANATATAIDLIRKKDGLEFLGPSRMFLYYNARLLNGDADKDNGCCYRDILKCIYHTGTCGETLWDYHQDLLFTKPEDNCYSVAAQHKFQYYALLEQNLDALKHCLNEGYPFLFAIILYSPLEDDHMLYETGILSETPEEYRNTKGRHAVCCVGYDDKLGVFIVRNSWGPDWCMEGHFYIKYETMINPAFCDSFWTLRLTGILQPFNLA